MLAVGYIGKALFSISSSCAGKARFGVNSRLNWVIMLGLGMVSTPELCINIEKYRRSVVRQMAQVYCLTWV